MNYSINLSYDWPHLSEQESCRRIKQAGFTHSFSFWSAKDNHAAHFSQIENIRAAGLCVETVHLDFDSINDMWLDNENGQSLCEFFVKCTDGARECGVPVLIIHLSSSFTPPPLSKIGIERYRRICDRAGENSVAIAFENLRRTDYLDRIMDEFAEISSARFCFDCGHENLYNRGEGVLEAHSDKLSALHLHDNFGMSDDHMLPFDGKINWERLSARLAPVMGELPLTIETHMQNSGRLEYGGERFLDTAMERAKRLAAMVERERASL